MTQYNRQYYGKDFGEILRVETLTDTESETAVQCYAVVLINR
jgi:hypothetical protein